MRPILCVSAMCLLVLASILTAENPKFKHSFSNPENMLVQNTVLDLTIDFDRQVVGGLATLTVKKIAGNVLILDASKLAIKSISGDIRSWEKKIDQAASARGLGEALVIHTKDLDNLTIVIDYESAPGAPGLKWLKPESTRSGQPLMFALNEPIGARSWFPCQDTPAVRGTYAANLKVIAHNRVRKEPLIALIAGENNPRESNGAMIYKNLTSTKAPIPSYLFVIAAGDFSFREMDKVIGVYADNKQSLEDAMQGLKDAPKYFARLKSVLGDAPWPRQDFLIVPGLDGIDGMENPMLIYFNEDLVDRAGTSRYIAAHELAHMWTSNLATIKEWSSLWINEGLPTYFEDRLLEEVHGKAVGEANARKSYQDLLDAESERLKNPSNNLTQLTCMQKVDNGATHPMDLVDFAVYPKASSMFHHIEKIISRDTFDKFIREYLKDFRYVPVTVDAFINYGVKKLGEIYPQLDWASYLRKWIFEPGLKPAMPNTAHP